MLLSWYLGGTSANPNPYNLQKQGPAVSGGFPLGALNLTTVTTRVPSGVAGGATQRITGSISEDTTMRVTGVITASMTVRVPTDVIVQDSLLLLEGDLSGALAFEGDDTSGYLKLQGDFI